MHKTSLIIITTLLLLLVSFRLKAQIKEITYGEIPKEDLEMAEYAPDPSADAVILENHAFVSMRSDEKITVVVNCHVRIKIINTDGLDYANVELPYGSDEKLMGLKATSYNLEDGAIVESRVDKKSIYYEKTSRYRNTIRFSVPNVRPGTLIEFTYTLESPDYFSLYTLELQHEIPVRRCNFQVEFPGYFEYKFIPGGDLASIRYKSGKRLILFGNRSVEGFTGTWSGNNIPAYREESFSTGSEDYYARLGFELSKINIPGYYFEEISPTYPRLSEKLMERTDFGEYITKAGVLRSKVAELKATGGSETDLLRRIYSFISEYMMWNGYSDFTASAAMSKIYKEARGNAADINLMLLSMLKAAGIQADPVILSTREHGLLNPLFAVISKFNHVVVSATADGKRYLIDATDPVRPFNMLPEECLNGEGWLVGLRGGEWVDLSNGEHHSEFVAMEMELDETGALTGKADNIYGSYDAWIVRKVCSLQGTEAYRDLMQSINSQWKISDLQLENLEDLEKPVIEKISLTIPDATDKGNGVMYLNPFLCGRIESNEFYAEERISVIDLACPWVKKYTCTITIPEGWSVAELPLSINLRMDGGGAGFICNFTADGRKVKVDSEITFSTVTFLPESYASIRKFYSDIIRKQSEVIILKKEI
ncbi:MAG TPA: DUF3857 domain-containing protein [Bacteroidales bacterium]|nr:DUF3857 domain-containing protein [Bacteroidales bacterium]